METTFSQDLLVVSRHLVVLGANSQLAAQASEAAANQGAFDAYKDVLFANRGINDGNNDANDGWEDLADPTERFVEFATQAQFGMQLNEAQFRADLTSQATLDRIQRDVDSATALGVNSTPRFFLNGVQIVNPATENDFENVVQTVINDYDDPFIINRETGQLLVATPSALDFETTQTLNINVLARDASGNMPEDVPVIVNLTDEAEQQSFNGEGEGGEFAAAADDLFAEEDDWLAMDDVLDAVL